LRSCRRQMVCAVCDEIKPPEAVGHQVIAPSLRRHCILLCGPQCQTHFAVQFSLKLSSLDILPRYFS
jgi:hypothetical protein